METQVEIFNEESIPYWSWQSDMERCFRKSAPDYIKHALNHGLMQYPGPYRVTFLGDKFGEEAVIAKLEVGNGETFALKMIQTPGVVTAEAAFLTAWRAVGVSTPQIISVLHPDSEVPVDIIVMQYIFDPILSKTHPPAERITLGIATKMGQVLARLHQAKGIGYGRPSKTDPLIGVCTSFAGEMEKEISQRLPILIDQGVLAKQTEKLAQVALELLEQDTKSRLPALTHCDFKPKNLFVSPEGDLTVFDPNCRITHPCMCLALSLIRLACEGDDALEAESMQFLTGYNKIEKYDDDVLKAALLLRGLLVLSTWVRKGKQNDSKRLLKYLVKSGAIR